MVGTALKDRYLIEEKVSEGGMAVVYRAQDSVLNRKVAVKVMRPELLRDPQYRERFKQEAKAAASLSHPHLANVYDFGEHEGNLFIVMEYLSPRTLKDLIAQQGPLPPSAAAEVGLQICDALKYAHGNGIIHRDIKPQNVLFTSDGRVKVSDFGIAQAMGAGGLTAPGEVIGSVYYISPEQARGERATERSDIYGLGAVLYEALTGKVPFEGDNAVAVALKHVQEEAVAPRQVNPAIPPDLETIVLRAMRKDPLARYASAAEMMQDLTRARQGQPVTAGPAAERAQTVAMPRVAEPRLERAPAPPVPAAPPAQEPVVLPWTWAVLVLTVVLVAGFAIYIWVLRGQGLGRQVRVPSVVGLREQEAQTQLSSAGFGMVVQERRPTQDYPVGTVISQDPENGTQVRQGEQIYVVLAAPPEKVTVPDVVDLAVDQAQQRLNEAGLEVGEIKTEFSSEVRPGQIIRQEPAAGKKVPPQTAVALWVASSESVVEPEPGTTEEPPTSKPGTTEGATTTATPEPSGEPTAKPKRENAEVEIWASRSTEEEDLRNITIGVTMGDAPHKIRIVVTDSKGARVVHEDSHQPGHGFKVTVQGHGDTRIEVYQDGQLLEEQQR